MIGPACEQTNSTAPSSFLHEFENFVLAWGDDPIPEFPDGDPSGVRVPVHPELPAGSARLALVASR